MVTWAVHLASKYTRVVRRIGLLRYSWRYRAESACTEDRFGFGGGIGGSYAFSVFGRYGAVVGAGGGGAKEVVVADSPETGYV